MSENKKVCWAEFFNYTRGAGAYCSARGCNNNSKTVPPVRFHHFPTNNGPRCEEWIERANLDHFRDFSTEKLNKKVLCGNHFAPEAYMNQHVRKRLRWDAVPTIFNGNGSNQNTSLVTSPEPDDKQLSPSMTEKESHDAQLLPRMKENEIPRKKTANKLQQTCLFNPEHELLLKKNMRKTINCLQSRLRRQAMKIEKLQAKLAGPMPRSAVINSVKEYLTGDTLTFIQMQIRQSGKRSFWNEKEKALAILMYENSRFMYRFFERKGFCMPSISRVKAWKKAFSEGNGEQTSGEVENECKREVKSEAPDVDVFEEVMDSCENFGNFVAEEVVGEVSV